MTTNATETGTDEVDGADGPAATIIGRVLADRGTFGVVVDPDYQAGLAGLDRFGHVLVMWWADQAGELAPHGPLVVEETPYVDGPDNVGVFATRSPNRPSPFGLSVAAIISVDQSAGRIDLGWIDAVDGTPVVDLKPYFPSSDRVRDPIVPDWCGSWPADLEASAHFDWETVLRQA